MDQRGVALGCISLEMGFWGMYHYTMAPPRAETEDSIAYLAAQADLSIVKRPRPPTAFAHAIAAVPHAPPSTVHNVYDLKPFSSGVGNLFGAAALSIAQGVAGDLTLM